MKQNDLPVNTLAMTTNVVLAAQMVERIMDRTVGLEGMAVFHGPAGYGKTMAIANAANLSRGYFITMRSAYSAKDILENICKEMGLSEKGRCGQLLDRIAENLAVSGRPLFIDEADHLVQKRKIELVRDMYDASQGAVVMIGEEGLPKKLEKWERVARRVMTWVGAEPTSARDATLLAKVYCPNVSLDDEVINHMLARANGSTGRLTIYLNNVSEFCATRSIDAITGSDLSDDLFPSGKAPRARTKLMGAAA